MNKLEDALKDIQNFLKARGVPYMIIGGIGNLVWGEPRMTVDIDITVHISDANEKDFIKDARSKFKVLVGNPDEFVKKYEGQGMHSRGSDHLQSDLRAGKRLAGY